MVDFKEIYHFSRLYLSRGPTFSGAGGGGGGGGEGSICLFPIETHFPGGGGCGPPVPPSGSVLV